MLVFQIEKERRPDGALQIFARVAGDLERSNLAHFRRVMDRLVKRGVRHVKLDMSRVSRVDLKGLGALEEFDEKLRRLGGALSVVGTELDAPGREGREGRD